MKNFMYTILFDVRGKLVAISVYAACIGNAKVRARYDLPEVDQEIAKFVSITATY